MEVPVIIVALFFWLTAAVWCLIGWATALAWTLTTRRRHRWAPHYEPGPALITTCTVLGPLALGYFLIVCAGLLLARALYATADRIHRTHDALHQGQP